MDVYNGSERRQCRRHNCHYQVSFKPKTDSKTYDYSQTRNISKMGAMLTTSDLYEKGAFLEIIMTIPFTVPTVKIEAEVIWTKKVPNALVYEVGIRFGAQDSVLSQFIAERLH